MKHLKLLLIFLALFAVIGFVYYFSINPNVSQQILGGFKKEEAKEVFLPIPSFIQAIPLESKQTLDMEAIAHSHALHLPYSLLAYHLAYETLRREKACENLPRTVSNILEGLDIPATCSKLRKNFETTDIKLCNVTPVCIFSIGPQFKENLEAADIKLCNEIIDIEKKFLQFFFSCKEAEAEKKGIGRPRLEIFETFLDQLKLSKEIESVVLNIYHNCYPRPTPWCVYSPQLEGKAGYCDGEECLYYGISEKSRECKLLLSVKIDETMAECLNVSKEKLKNDLLEILEAECSVSNFKLTPEQNLVQREWNITDTIPLLLITLQLNDAQLKNIENSVSNLRNIYKGEFWFYEVNGNIVSIDKLRMSPNVIFVAIDPFTFITKKHFSEVPAIYQVIYMLELIKPYVSLPERVFITQQEKAILEGVNLQSVSNNLRQVASLEKNFHLKFGLLQQAFKLESL
jgi:hypothetical protein